MARTLWRRLAATSVLSSAFVAFVGCNSILDNRPGTLVETDESDTLPSKDAGRTRDAAPAVVPGADGATAEAGGRPAPTCRDDEHVCAGNCVSSAEPLYGCGDPTCTRCPGAHAALGCHDGACVVAACDAGYSDCNANAADGCETDLSKAVSCGACNAACAEPAPLCTPTGATFQCTNGCTPAAPLRCGEACVDPLSNVTHCGACNVACPAVENATSACAAGVCAFMCTAPFHACAGKCVAPTAPTACGPTCAVCPIPPGGAATCIGDVCSAVCPEGLRLCGATCVAKTDPLACGPTCAVCPAAPNAVTSCAADVCALTCVAGFADCDAIPANGCESSLASDPLNCGGCGRPCGLLQVCIAGACVIRL